MGRHKKVPRSVITPSKANQKKKGVCDCVLHCVCVGWRRCEGRGAAGNPATRKARKGPAPGSQGRHLRVGGTHIHLARCRGCAAAAAAGPCVGEILCTRRGERSVAGAHGHQSMPPHCDDVDGPKANGRDHHRGFVLRKRQRGAGCRRPHLGHGEVELGSEGGGQVLTAPV